MKYLSTLVLLALVFWSWTAVNAPASVSLVTHVGLQDNLKEIISEKIHEMLPEAKDVVFKQMETRSLSETQVEATFTYSYKQKSNANEPAAKTTLSGQAILNQHTTPAQAPGAAPEIAWSFDKLQINGQDIDFDEQSPDATGSN